jgi:protein-disulfide isomerase
MRRYLPFTIVGLVALLTLGSGAALYRAKRPVELTLPKNRAESAHIRGNPKAPVTLEEYGDYECPPCGKLAGPLKRLEHDYGDRLRITFHHFPLVVHAHAKEAAYAAEAAALQGKFWEMHDLLYKDQGVWAKAPEVKTLFAGYAGVIGLDVERFKQDLESDQVKTRVASDAREAAKVGVTATPTVFINNRAVLPQGEDPTKPLRAAIDEALKQKPSS